MSALARDTAIVGIGQTEFSKHSGRSELQLAGEAVAAAVADAGLTPADVDGAVTFAMDVNDELAVMRCAGIPSLRYTARTRGGGGGACATVQLASAAVASGAADAVVVYRAFNERSGRRFGQPPMNRRSRIGAPFGSGRKTPVRMKADGESLCSAPVSTPRRQTKSYHQIERAEIGTSCPSDSFRRTGADSLG